MAHDICAVSDLVSIDAVVPCSATMNHLISKHIQTIKHDGKDSNSLLLAHCLLCRHFAVLKFPFPFCL